ncbi:nitrilotriacetate monooxygenase [Serinibacter arcticus]|uniref:Nitrilotriacetate monooxygenase n=1 Tax=Serinibacter arcticus TaxID=1655435 RepID=A0A2U1ZVH4_9MICO|nr:LLM class flavin-dependent oxidoreductase [Serinibacter arcticus]PWD50922.1 nitrilotriacetate monooxygenase [Serinibacter arcticus]
MSQRPLVVAVELDGHGAHPAAWRASAEQPGAVFDPAVLRRTVLAAENGGFALATFDDALTTTQATASAGGVAGRLDAVVRSAFVAPLTARVGLGPRVDPRGVEPFHLAAQLASLDIASLGRGAWVVGDADQPALADAVDRVVPESPEDRRREVADVVTTVRRLWDSWEDDAVIKDVTTGRYIDRDRVHAVEVVTPTFSVAGASITPRPPQGQLVVLAADTALDPAAADVSLVGGRTVEDVLARAAAARAAGAPRVLAEIEVLLDAADAAAPDRLTALEAHAVWTPTDALRFVGSASGLLFLLEQLAGAVDGVRFHPAVLSADLPVLTRSVLPRLLAAGLTRPPRAGQTLRSVLDLPRPENTFTRKDAA